MKSYKTAQFRLDTTGAGREGFQYDSFVDEIVNKHCIYYHELKPILADRPNVTPWATNFNSSDESDLNDQNHDENESVATNSNIGASVIEILSGDDDSMLDINRAGCSSPSTKCISQLTDDMCSSSSATKHKTKDHDISFSSATTSIAKNSKNKSKENTVVKISPADAKQKQQSLLRQRKKQIMGVNTKAKSKLSVLLDAEEEDRKFLMEARCTKMEFEINKQLKYTTTGTCTIRNTRKFRKMSLDLADENTRVRTLKRQF
jgi:hypothetical protein